MSKIDKEIKSMMDVYHPRIVTYKELRRKLLLSVTDLSGERTRFEICGLWELLSRILGEKRKRGFYFRLSLRSGLTMLPIE